MSTDLNQINDFFVAHVSTAGNSSSMLQTLLEKHSNSIKVTILTTDRHVQIRAFLEKEYKILHRFDAWHFGKSEKKKIKKKNFWIYLTFFSNFYLSIFCHTGSLEVFHSVLNKSSPKRFHFTLQGMIARTQLAVLDYNCGSNITQATRNDGKRRNKHFFY